jgi:hypothetical protein
VFYFTLQQMFQNRQKGNLLMKKLLIVSFLTLVLLNILLFSLPIVSVAQEDATEEAGIEATEEVETGDSSADDNSGSNAGSNVAVFIGAGVAIAGGIFAAISLSRQSAKKVE